MTQEAFERGDWQAVIEAQRLESHDAAEWLRYGSALLHTIQAGPEAGKQQQQAALAFVQAQREGASADAVAAAQRQAVMTNLHQALKLVEIPPPAKPQPPTALRRMLLVLGMHSSGTSALASLLCQQGFQGPHKLDANDAHNPTRYGEPRQLRAFHNRLLEEAQSHWEDPLLSVLPWPPPHLEAALADLEQALDADFPTTDPEAVALIKDPGQCRLLPVWKALFEQRPYRVAVVLAIRQPEAVAASLVSRDQLPLDRALLLWLSHTLEAERTTRQLPRLIVSYEELLQNPVAVVQRCQKLAGLPITTPLAEALGAWIRHGLNRHTDRPEEAELKGKSPALLEWANTVYAALVEAAAEKQRQLLDRAQVAVQQRLQTLLEQSSRQVQLLLFWEAKAGDGSSEAASQRRSVMLDCGRIQVVFQLPTKAAHPHQLRLTLVDKHAIVTVRNVRLRTASGTLLWRWSGAEVNPMGKQRMLMRSAHPHTLMRHDEATLTATRNQDAVLDIPAITIKELENIAEMDLSLDLDLEAQDT